MPLPTVSLQPNLLHELIQLRHTIHQHPELSGQEDQTAQRLQQFVAQYVPDQVMTGLGGHGLAVVYCGREPGPTLMMRADMDGLPIQEANAIAHRSQVPSTCHACGHDGHMTMVAGLAALLHQRPIQRGRAILLFQPAEETGAGAAQVVASPQFADLEPDYVYALHNLPRYPLGQVVVRSREFAAASKGVKIFLQGHPSHAAHPEHGNSPALAMTALVNGMTHLPQSQPFEDFVLVTVVHARLGEVAFGTSPGEATVMATLRSYRDTDMVRLTEAVRQLAERVAGQDGLKLHLEWTEEFPATVNHPDAVDHLKRAIATCELDWLEAEQPFRWSEDFGHYTQRYPGALFGLGAGEQQPQLHNANYDFPDALIEIGVSLFAQLIYDQLGAAI